MRRADPGRLTERELAVARAFAGGSGSREVGEALGIAQSTVRTHLLKVYEKLGVRTKVGLAAALRPMEGEPPAQDRAAAVAAPDLEGRPARIAVIRPFDPSAGEAGLLLLGAAAQAATAALVGYPDVRIVVSGPGRRPPQAADLGGVARELGADFLVLPGVSVVAEGAELMLQLVDRRGVSRWTASAPSPLPLPAPRAEVAALAARFAAEVAGLRGEVVRLERLRRMVEAGEIDAYGLYLAAGERLEVVDAPSAEAAVALSERAAALDPLFPRAWLMLAWCRHGRASLGWAPHDPPEREAAAFRRATELAPRDGLGFAYLALARAKQGARGEGERLIERAEALAGSCADVAAETTLGLVGVAGRPERALRLIDDALARCPDPPPPWRYMEARAAWFAGFPERALRATDHAPDGIPKLVMRALAAAELGDAATAAQAMARLRVIAPGLDFARYAESLPFVHPAAVARWRQGLRRLAAVGRADADAR